MLRSPTAKPTFRRYLLASLALALVPGCDSGGGGGYYPGAPTVDPSADVSLGDVKVGLINGNVFPTFIHHIFGADLTGDGDVFYFAKIPVTNVGPNAVETVVSVELQGYGAPGTQLVALQPGETQLVKLNPPFDSAKLIALSSKTPSSVVVRAVANDGSGVVFDEFSQQTEVATKNDVFWQLVNGDAVADAHFLVVALVTPHAPEVEALIADAADHSEIFQMMLGYQYMGSSETVTGTYDVAPGEMKEIPAPFAPGTAASVSVDVTCSFCSVYNAAYGLWFDDIADYVLSTGGLGSWTGQYNIATGGMYWHVMENPASNSSNRQFTLRRTISLYDGAFDQMKAVYDALQARGLSYTSISANFFGASQHVKLPSESITSTGANCIDGALLFASAFEAIGMQSAIAILPGHALVVVRTQPEGDYFPIETTMVGTHGFYEAVSRGMEVLNNAGDGVQLIWIDRYRDLGFTPLPVPR